jgi:hypothetical protein
MVQGVPSCKSCALDTAEKEVSVTTAAQDVLNLNALDRLNELFLNKRLQTAIDHCLVKFRFCFEMLSPYA